MSLIKYKIRDIAKDFGKQPKEISAIVAKCSEEPKSNMQVLEDHELAFVFEYLTQNNQVESIESIFADVYHEPKAADPAKTEAPAAKEQPKAKQGEPAKTGDKPQQSNEQKQVPLGLRTVDAVEFLSEQNRVTHLTDSFCFCGGFIHAVGQKICVLFL